jgi:hypothetical protein
MSKTCPDFDAVCFDIDNPRACWNGTHLVPKAKGACPMINEHDGIRHIYSSQFHLPPGGE